LLKGIDKMNFEEAFIDSWKKALEEREINTDIDFYKVKEKNTKRPVPKKKVNKKCNFKVSHIIKVMGYLFIIFNILYITLKVAGIDMFKPYGDMMFSLLKKIKVLKFSAI